MITYKRNKNLGELIGGHTLQGGKVSKTHLQIIKGESKSCNTTNKSSLCCTQVVNTKTFESYQTKRTFKNFHKLSCKSSFVVYLTESTLCKINVPSLSVCLSVSLSLSLYILLQKEKVTIKSFPDTKM